VYDYYGEFDMESGIFDDSVGAKDYGGSKASNNMEACFTVILCGNQFFD
jgi:hypothetical protein